MRQRATVVCPRPTVNTFCIIFVTPRKWSALLLLLTIQILTSLLHFIHQLLRRRKIKLILCPLELRPQCGRIWICAVKLTTHLQLPAGKPTPKSRLQPRRQSRNKIRTIFCPIFSPLLPRKLTALISFRFTMNRRPLQTWLKEMLLPVASAVIG